MQKTLLVWLALAASLPAQWVWPNPVTGVQQQTNGVTLTMQAGATRIELCTDSIVHVLYSPTGIVCEPPGLCGHENQLACGAVEGRIERQGDRSCYSTAEGDCHTGGRRDRL